jgi:hypothetical protein
LVALAGAFADLVGFVGLVALAATFEVFDDFEVLDAFDGFFDDFFDGFFEDFAVLTAGAFDALAGLVVARAGLRFGAAALAALVFAGGLAPLVGFAAAARACAARCFGLAALAAFAGFFALAAAFAGVLRVVAMPSFSLRRRGARGVGDRRLGTTGGASCACSGGREAADCSPGVTRRRGFAR